MGGSGCLCSGRPPPLPLSLRASPGAPMAQPTKGMGREGVVRGRWAPRPTEGKAKGKERGRGEGQLGQGGRGRSQGGEKPMGTTADGGKGSKGRAANGDRPIGAASCRRDHHTQGVMPNPLPPPLSVSLWLCRSLSCWSSLRPPPYPPQPPCPSLPPSCCICALHTWGVKPQWLTFADVHADVHTSACTAPERGRRHVGGHQAGQEKPLLEAGRGSAAGGCSAVPPRALRSAAVLSGCPWPCAGGPLSFIMRVSVLAWPMPFWVVPLCCRLRGSWRDRPRHAISVGRVEA